MPPVPWNIPDLQKEILKSQDRCENEQSHWGELNRVGAGTGDGKQAGSPTPHTGVEPLQTEQFLSPVGSWQDPGMGLHSLRGAEKYNWRALKLLMFFGVKLHG